MNFPNPLALLTPRRKPRSGFADIYLRALAAAIDLGLIFLLFGTLFRYLTYWLYRSVDRAKLAQADHAPNPIAMVQLLWDSHLLPLWLVNAGIQLVLIGAVLVGLQCHYGATAGKWILGLRVVRYPSLEKPGCFRLALRYLAYIPAAGALMIGIFWISFNRNRRGWHDYIAGTAVLSTRGAGWYWHRATKLWRHNHGREDALDKLPDEPEI